MALSFRYFHTDYFPLLSCRWKLRSYQSVEGQAIPATLTTTRRRTSACLWPRNARKSLRTFRRMRVRTRTPSGLTLGSLHSVFRWGGAETIFYIKSYLVPSFRKADWSLERHLPCVQFAPTLVPRHGRAARAVTQNTRPLILCFFFVLFFFLFFFSCSVSLYVLFLPPRHRF